MQEQNEVYDEKTNKEKNRQKDQVENTDEDANKVEDENNLIFVTETISRTDQGQPRPKYIFNKCETNIYFFTLQRFCPSPSPNFK